MRPLCAFARSVTLLGCSGRCRTPEQRMSRRCSAPLWVPRSFASRRRRRPALQLRGAADRPARPGQPAARAPPSPGAGATFPNPIYSKWFDAYARETGVRINYQSIGSGGGIRQFTEGTVDFGATDGPDDRRADRRRARRCAARPHRARRRRRHLQPARARPEAAPVRWPHAGRHLPRAHHPVERPPARAR